VFSEVNTGTFLGTFSNGVSGTLSNVLRILEQMLRKMEQEKRFYNEIE